MRIVSLNSEETTAGGGSGGVALNSNSVRGSVNILSQTVGGLQTFAAFPNPKIV